MFEGVLAIEGVQELGIQKCESEPWALLMTAQIEQLLYGIRSIYHAPNPYHNYVHALDVLQATYTFLVAIGVVPPFSYLREPVAPWCRPEMDASRGTERARDVLRPQDVLAVLVAAMGHDVGHPGLSNAFMVSSMTRSSSCQKNAKTPLSQVYDDKSVLENMHCMLIVQLLRKHGFGYLIGPGRDEEHDWRGFRTVLHSAILATDMSLHFAWIQRLREFGTRPSDDEGDDLEDRVLVCQALIKCADISNPTRPIAVSEHWSTVLLQEWAMQASLEQQLSLPVSVVASADASLQAKGQVGFIDLFTQPLFDAASDAMPRESYLDQADFRTLAICCELRRQPRKVANSVGIAAVFKRERAPESTTRAPSVRVPLPFVTSSISCSSSRPDSVSSACSSALV